MYQYTTTTNRMTRKVTERYFDAQGVMYKEVITEYAEQPTYFPYVVNNSNKIS